ncbi:MAG: hypothetical protein ACYCXY_11035, partial [Acidimicrobiales bacterium]
MNAEAVDGPRVPTRAPRASGPDSLNAVAAAWTRAFFSHRSWVAAALATIGALAVVSVLPLRDWPRSSLIALSVAAGAAAAVSGVLVAVGSRLPRWSLQVVVALGNLIVSVIAAASATEHVDLANLYLLVELFAILYLPLRTALVQSAAAGAAYAVVLGLGPRLSEPPIVAWLAV